MSTVTAQTTPTTQKKRKIPGPSGWPLVGNIPELKSDPLAFFPSVLREHGDVVALKLGPQTAYVLGDPEDIKRVLADNAHNYEKTAKLKKVTKEVMGNGLVANDGEAWREHRRISQPAFHKERIEGFAQVFAGYAEALIADWPKVGEMDLQPEMNKLSIRIIGKTLFSLDREDIAEDVAAGIEDASAYAYKQVVSAIPTPSFLPTPAMRRYLSAAERLDKLVYGLIADWREAGTDNGDLLSMLSAARLSATGEQMTDQQLRDEVMNFLLAGYETTSNALAWTLYVLGQNPKTQTAVRAEIADVLGDRPAGFEDAPRLELLTRVIQESMRLYPPGWILHRQSLKDDQFGEYTVAAGSQFFIVPYATHRDARFWKNPDRFDPDHFLPEAVAARHPFAYMPFGAGQRKCIASHFSLLNLQVSIATIVRKFAIATTKESRPEPAFTLVPEGGVHVKLAAV